MMSFKSLEGGCFPKFDSMRTPKEMGEWGSPKSLCTTFLVKDAIAVCGSVAIKGVRPTIETDVLRLEEHQDELAGGRRLPTRELMQPAPDDTDIVVPLCEHPIVDKRQKSTKVILAALKIEMGHPHMTASALAVIYPERHTSLKPMRVPIRRSNIDPKRK
jgi:hypothetical protein